MKMDIVLCGVGGQGVLLASEILSVVALKAGYDVKKSEIHGMAQRGGSVFSFVRISEKVYSPIIPEGKADFLLAFEELEALRYARYLCNSGKIIVNTQKISPITVLSGEAVYPENVIETLKEHFEVYSLDGIELAQKAGNIKAVNTVIMGAFSVFSPFSKELWLDALKDLIPEKILSVNIKAFEMGRKSVEGEVS